MIPGHLHTLWSNVDMANKNGILCNLLLPELEISNEDFLEISWALHDVVSEKVHPRYVSQQDINDKS